MQRKILTFSFVLLIWTSVFSQIIVNKGIYKANFSNKFREPRYVSYILCKGGGSCNRDKFSFKNDDAKLQSATDIDY